MAEKKDEKQDERKLDPKYLKGLEFQASETKTVEEEGRKVRKFIPRTRALRPGDVLCWADKGDHVVIVAADGRKYQVKK